MQPDAASPVPPAVAATWRTVEPSTAWLPESLADALPWGREVEYRDTEALQRLAAGGWQLLGISHRGRVHAHEGTHREDAMAVVAGTHGFALAASDGAGSSRWSRVAAACVCRCIARESEPLLHQGLAASDAASRLQRTLTRALRCACEELHAGVTAAGGAARDVRTTALAVILVDGWLASIQVGDGAIFSVTRDGRVSRRGTGDAGSYSGEVGAFVPEVDDASLAARIVVTPLPASPDDRPEAILLLTDGVEDPFYPVERRGAEIARQLYHGVSAPAEGFRAQAAHGPIVGSDEALPRLARWIDFERRGENDDRTLVGAFRLPPAFLG